MSYEVTGLVIAKNEEADLGNCLEALTGICPEVVVIDNESTDNTAIIAKSFGCVVIQQEMDETGFGGLRNFGLEQINTSHVLVLDADERPTPQLTRSIRSAISERKSDVAYRMSRRTNIMGGWVDHGRFDGDGQVRLMPSEVRYTGIVHEYPLVPEEYEIVELDGYLEHFTYASLTEYVSKARKYAELGVSSGTPKPSVKEIVLKPFKNLIVNQGLADGWRGAVAVSIDAWHDIRLRKNHIQAEKRQCVITPIVEKANIV